MEKADAEARSSVQFQSPQPSNRGAFVRELPPVNSIPKKCKHYGWPGSIRATRVEYEFDQSAFASSNLLTSEKKERKAEIQVFKWHSRLGRRPQWNSSVESPERFPDRAMMHTISEYQSQRPVFNYRAEALPQLYHTTAFIPKGNKFKFSKAAEVIHPASDKRTLVTKNVGLSTRVEFVDPAAPRGPAWDTSTQLSRRELAVLDEKLRQQALNATKAQGSKLLESSTYLTPKQKTTALNQTLKEARLAALAQCTIPKYTEPEPYTLSKMRLQRAKEEAEAAAEAQEVQLVVEPTPMSNSEPPSP